MRTQRSPSGLSCAAVVITLSPGRRASNYCPRRAWRNSICCHPPRPARRDSCTPSGGARGQESSRSYAPRGRSVVWRTAQDRSVRVQLERPWSRQASLRIRSGVAAQMTVAQRDRPDRRHAMRTSWGVGSRGCDDDDRDNHRKRNEAEQSCQGRHRSLMFRGATRKERQPGSEGYEPDEARKRSLRVWRAARPQPSTGHEARRAVGW